MEKSGLGFVREVQGDIKRQLISLGAKKKTIEKFFEGVFILDCPQCKTYNLCEVDSFEETVLYLEEKKIDLEKYGDCFDIFYFNGCEDYAIRYKKEK